MSTDLTPSLSGAFHALSASDWVPSVTPVSTAAASASPHKVDWHTVVVLRRHAAEQLGEITSQWLAQHHAPMAPDDRLVRGRAVIRSVVRRHAVQLSDQGTALWPQELEDLYATAVESAIFGYGRLQPLFEIPDAENVEINGFDSVFIQYGDGRRVEHPPVADSDEELVDAIRFLGETATPPRPFDDAHPTMTLALGERFRLHAIGFGLSHRPSVIIRQHIHTDVTLKELALGGLMPMKVAEFLHAAVAARKSIVVSGDQGAGKTTLLRALIAAIPLEERFGTIETDYELLTHLQPRRRNMVALQAKIGLGETTSTGAVGAWSVADLIPEALRQNLSRLIVGEVRGGEAGAMLQAMTSGAGSLSTTHSHSAAATIDRLAGRVAEGGVLTLPEAMRQIAHNLHFLVHVVLDDQSWRGGQRRRYISEVRQLTGALENDHPTTHVVYKAATPTSPEIFHPEAVMAAELAPFYGGDTWE